MPSVILLGSNTPNYGSKSVKLKLHVHLEYKIEHTVIYRVFRLQQVDAYVSIGGKVGHFSRDMRLVSRNNSHFTQLVSFSRDDCLVSRAASPTSTQSDTFGYQNTANTKRSADTYIFRNGRGWRRSFSIQYFDMIRWKQAALPLLTTSLYTKYTVRDTAHTVCFLQKFSTQIVKLQSVYL